MASVPNVPSVYRGIREEEPRRLTGKELPELWAWIV
jgi:hypothetical protein